MHQVKFTVMADNVITFVNQPGSGGGTNLKVGEPNKKKEGNFFPVPLNFPTGLLLC